MLVGEPEKALDQLEPLLEIPFYISPGWLKIDPNFDPLRKTRGSRGSRRWSERRSPPSTSLGSDEIVAPLGAGGMGGGVSGSGIRS